MYGTGQPLCMAAGHCTLAPTRPSWRYMSFPCIEVDRHIPRQIPSQSIIDWKADNLGLVNKAA